MLIWSGWGFLGWLIPALCIWRIQKLIPVDNPANPQSVEQAMLYGYIIGVLVSAPIVWFLGRRLNRRTSVTSSEPPNGPAREAPPKRIHALFWVSLEYWALLWPGFALIKYVSHL